MSDKPWKVLERRAAGKVGGQRTPLSGGSSRHTRGDVIHDKLYVECKYSKRIAVIGIMHQAEGNATKEGKTPVLCLHQKGEKHDYFLVRDDHLRKVLSTLKGLSDKLPE